MNRHRKSSTTALAIILLATFLCGCGGIGAHSVARDRFDYTDAISSSWKQQMLVNMVKLRYGDTPVFLDVVSVINQYALEAQVDVRWNWVDPVVTVGDSHTAGGAARYSDKPTITYAPLTGERFARSIMKPIPPPAVLSLIQAGYPVDVVLRVCTNSVNGVRNRYGGSARARPADPEFKPLLEALRRIQDAGGMGLRVRKTNETDATLLVLRDKGDRTASVAQDVAFVRKTLGLDPAADTFTVAYGSVAKDDKELAILTRSMLEILVDLASCIEVPPRRRPRHARRPDRSPGRRAPDPHSKLGDSTTRYLRLRQVQEPLVLDRRPRPPLQDALLVPDVPLLPHRNRIPRKRPHRHDPRRLRNWYVTVTPARPTGGAEASAAGGGRWGGPNTCTLCTIRAVRLTRSRQ